MSGISARLMCAAIVAIASVAIASVGNAAGDMTPSTGFRVSFAAGVRDADGRFIGGTELRYMVAHQGRLYAGNGYWEDRFGSEGRRGAQILALDASEGAWKLDHEFDEELSDRRRRHLAISALREIAFGTDETGRPLPHPVSLLVASTWDLTGTRQVFVRDDASGTWAGTTLAQDTPAPGFLPQVRSFAMYRDRTTGADYVFAGDTRGVFAGVYDPASPAISAGVPGPSSTPHPSRATAFRDWAAACASAASPRRTARFTPPSARRSSGATTAPSRNGGSSIPTRGRPIRRPASAA